jgi:hypothetical protein
VISSDPTVALKLAISGFGIAILPLWMPKKTDVRNALMPILPQWTPEPITLCALFSSPSRLTPKVKFCWTFSTTTSELIGTPRSNRCRGCLAAQKLSLDLNNDTTIGWDDDTPKQGDAASGNKSQFGFWQSENTGNAVENDLVDLAVAYLRIDSSFLQGRGHSRHLAFTTNSDSNLI